MHWIPWQHHAATGKGFAIGSAALTALALIASYIDKVKQIDDLLDGYQESDIHDIIEKIRRISGEIIEEL